jgi:hypothetical protein
LPAALKVSAQPAIARAALSAANVSRNPGERVASAMNATYQGTIVFRPVNSPFQS